MSHVQPRLAPGGGCRAQKCMGSLEVGSWTEPSGLAEGAKPQVPSRQSRKVNPKRSTWCRRTDLSPVGVGGAGQDAAAPPNCPGQDIPPTPHFLIVQSGVGYLTSLGLVWFFLNYKMDVMMILKSTWKPCPKHRGARWVRVPSRVLGVDRKPLSK